MLVQHPGRSWLQPFRIYRRPHFSRLSLLPSLTGVKNVWKQPITLKAMGPWHSHVIFQTVVASVQVASTPNVRAVAKSLAPAPAVQQQLVMYAKSCVQPALQHQLQTNLKVPSAALKATWFFSSCKITNLKPSASEVMHYTGFSFPFLYHDLVGLKGLMRMGSILQWTALIGGGSTQRYSQHGLLLPKVLIVQLFSAAAKRAFSLLNSMFGGNSLKDYTETSATVRYRKIVVLHRQPLNEAWVWAGGYKQSLPGCPQGQSKTCYQVCGCHSQDTRWQQFNVHARTMCL